MSPLVIPTSPNIPRSGDMGQGDELKGGTWPGEKGLIDRDGCLPTGRIDETKDFM